MNEELPTWEQMSDSDRAVALRHAWLRHWAQISAHPLREDPLVAYTGPGLRDLNDRAAAQHAVSVCGTWDEALTRLGTREVERLLKFARR